MYKKLTAVIMAIVSGTLLGIKSAPDVVKVPETSSQTAIEIQYDQGARYALSYNEHEYICKTVMAEAGGESYRGQQMVAQCILNACRLNHERPIEIVKAYHYTSPASGYSESVRKAVESVFTNGEIVIDSRTTLFYAPKRCSSSYHESQIFVCKEGGHKFFIEKKFF